MYYLNFLSKQDEICSKDIFIVLYVIQCIIKCVLQLLATSKSNGLYFKDLNYTSFWPDASMNSKQEMIRRVNELQIQQLKFIMKTEIQASVP